MRCSTTTHRLSSLSRLPSSFPDFRALSRAGAPGTAVDAVLITHFHLDHCGALPLFTEGGDGGAGGGGGFAGPVYMTAPTAALLPLMLEDYHRVMASRGGGGDRDAAKGEHAGAAAAAAAPAFTRADIRACMSKVVPVPLRASVPISGAPHLRLTAHYAGHVLGAAMFDVLDTRSGARVVYTGDYNMTPDRHLGPARLPRLRPDLLITESTYATTVRGPKRAREAAFLEAVMATVLGRGGKVLIPVFALGRAQELMMLLDDAWARAGLSVPIFYSPGLASRATAYYRLLTGWTAERVREGSLAGAPAFDFSRMQPFTRQAAGAPGPCVLLATPGMLHGGQSLEMFVAWAPDPRNLIILPGYCVSGTVGAKLMGLDGGGGGDAGGGGGGGGGPPRRTVEVDKRTTVDVRCGVRYLSFSAHADAKGIAALVAGCAPRAVMLVHGERGGMAAMKARLERTAGMPVLMPATGRAVAVECRGGPGPPGGVASGGLVGAATRPVGLESAESAGAGPAASAAAAVAMVGAGGWRPAPPPPASVVEVCLAPGGGPVAMTPAEAAGGSGGGVTTTDGLPAFKKHALSLGCRLVVGSRAATAQPAALVAAAAAALASAVRPAAGPVRAGPDGRGLSVRSFTARLAAEPEPGGAPCFDCAWAAADGGLADACLAVLRGALL